MAVVARAGLSFDLKNTSLSGLALILRTTDLGLLGAAMADRFGTNPGVFSYEAVVIDLAAVADETHAEVDFVALNGLLKSHQLLPSGVRNGSPQQSQAALAAGLGEAPEHPFPHAAPQGSELAIDAPIPEQPAESATVVAQVPAPSSTFAPTLIVDRPLRSGQQVYAKGGDLVVLATVNVGAEVIADGSIHVYGPLRGKAVAGAKGNADARIFSTCMEPQLLAIAGTYRTTETPLPVDVLGKPAQIRLDGERLVFEPLASAAQTTSI